MKNIRILLVALLAMAAVSCLNDNLSDTKKTDSIVASLDEQVLAIESTISEIESVMTKVDSEIHTSELSKIKSDLNQHIGFLKSEATWLSGTMETLQMQKALASITGSLSVEDPALAQIEKGAAEWLGKEFTNHYKTISAYAKTETLAAKLGLGKETVDGIASDVEAGLRKEVEIEDLSSIGKSMEATAGSVTELSCKLETLSQEVEEGYITVIEETVTNSANVNLVQLSELNANASLVLKSTTSSLASLTDRVETLENQINEIISKLDEIDAEIEGLLNMIQSLTFVSEYSSDYAYAYYEMLNTKVSGTGKPYDYKYNDRKPIDDIELSYIVRPASAAKALTAQKVSMEGYYANKISQSAISSSNFITFTVKDVKVVDETRGLVTVTIAHDLKKDFYFKEIGAKCALSIKSGKTDIASKFVEICPKDISGTVYVESIKVTESSVEIAKGETTKLTAAVTPSNATTKTCKWKSNKESVVKVNADTGEIEAVGVGEATITATSDGTDEWGVPMTATCNVKVNEAIRLSGAPYVEVGYTAELFLDYPKDMIVESKSWSSSDPTKATVDKDGKVTGVASTYSAAEHEYNYVTISCIINGTTVSHDMVVVVTQPKKLKITGIDDNASEVSIKVDEKLSLAATIDPATASSDHFRLYYSSDQALGWINKDTGMINEYANTMTPVSAWVYIEVKNVDKEYYLAPNTYPKRTLVVKVEPYYVKTISLDDVELEPGLSATLKPIFTSDKDGVQPTYTGVTWSSSNTNVATVTEDGVVNAIGVGETTITARSTHDKTKFGTCKVSVTQPWKSFDVGDYLVKTSDNKIEFASELNTAKSKGTIVGVVIAKVNPRVNDTRLPEDCVHGIAVGLVEGSGQWWNTSPSSEPYKLYLWAEANGYESTAGIDWIGGANTRLSNAYLYMGYNNTSAMKEFISAKGLTSGMINALNSWRSKLQRPSGTSEWYIPSVAEMDAIAANGEMISQKIAAASGVALSDEPYWTTSDSMNSYTYAALINPLTGAVTGNLSKTSDHKFRVILAF